MSISEPESSVKFTSPTGTVVVTIEQGDGGSLNLIVLYVQQYKYSSWLNDGQLLSNSVKY